MTRDEGPSQVELRALYAREPDDVLLEALRLGPGAYTASAWKVIAEEATRRGLSTDARGGLLADLQQLEIDWRSFRDTAFNALKLLDIEYPAGSFWSAPSPHSFVQTMDALLGADLGGAILFRQLLDGAAVENALVQIASTARTTGNGYLHIRYAIPITITKMLETPPSYELHVSRPTLIAAYLSAYAGAPQVLPLVDATQAAALQLAHLTGQT